MAPPFYPSATLSLHLHPRFSSANLSILLRFASAITAGLTLWLAGRATGVPLLALECLIELDFCVN